jgi:hypothetical protein
VFSDPEFERPKTSGKSTQTNWKQAEPTPRPEAECQNDFLTMSVKFVQAELLKTAEARM